MSDLKSLIPNATTAELELVSAYGSLKDNPRRERAFSAFAKTGLPHRRMEAWKWTDFRVALPEIGAAGLPVADPFAGIDGPVIVFTPTGIDVSGELPAGLRISQQGDASAFSGAEDLPLGALTAALAGGVGGPASVQIEVTQAVDVPLRIVCCGDGGTLNMSRMSILVRPDARSTVLESHIGGAGLSSHLLDFSLQRGAALDRVVYQDAGATAAQAITATAQLDGDAQFTQTMLAFGGAIARLETRVTHQEHGAKATLNAAYLASAGRHVDITTHVRHGAPSCMTRQVTKGAVFDGGRGVFQGKFHVPRHVAQYTDADMQHHALLLENGAEVNAKPELEIYADDVECAHGNTCGALDGDQLFYMRQRGIPEAEAKALLTNAFIVAAFGDAPANVAEILENAAALKLLKI